MSKEHCYKLVITYNNVCNKLYAMFKRKIIDYLVNWKNKKTRKPLIIRGVRQVGKTSAVLIFAKKHFKNLIHLNLEKAEHLIIRIYSG